MVALTDEEDYAAVALPLIHSVDLASVCWQADPEVPDERRVQRD